MSEEIQEQKEELKFEEKIEKAKVLLEKLSNPEITLSQSVNLYKDGLKEIEEAQKLLEEAKMEFEVLNKDKI